MTQNCMFAIYESFVTFGDNFLLPPFQIISRFDLFGSSIAMYMLRS